MSIFIYFSLFSVKYIESDNAFLLNTCSQYLRAEMLQAFLTCHFCDSASDYHSFSLMDSSLIFFRFMLWMFWCSLIFEEDWNPFSRWNKYRCRILSEKIRYLRKQRLPTRNLKNTKKLGRTDLKEEKWISLCCIMSVGNVLLSKRWSVTRKNKSGVYFFMLHVRLTTVSWFISTILLGICTETIY